MAKKTQNPSSEGASNNAELKTNFKAQKVAGAVTAQKVITSEEPIAAPVPVSELPNYYNQLKAAGNITISPYGRGISVEKAGLSAFVRGTMNNEKTGKLKVEIYPDPDNITVLVGFLHHPGGKMDKLHPQEAFDAFSTLKDTLFVELAEGDSDR